VKAPGDFARWSVELAEIPSPTLTFLAPWLARLDLAMGLRSLRRTEDTAVPDGFDGLARRGSLEHLLASEWLMLRELPEEFLRRTVAGELTFLRRATQRRESSRALLLLCDAGPEQVGAPRLVHFALGLVLARRARSLGVHFRWGVAQDAEGPMFDGFDRRAAEHFVAARTLSRVDSRALTGWKERFARVFAGESEFVLVGGPSLESLVAQTAPAPHLVVVREPLDGRESVLKISVRATSGLPKHLELERLAPRQTVQLLRDPLCHIAPDAPRTDGSLLLTADGTKALLRTPEGLLVIPLPNSPRGKTGRLRSWETRGFPMGVALARGGHVVLEAARSSRTLSLVRAGKETRVGHFTEHEQVHAPWAPSSRAPLAPLWTPSLGERFLFEDEKRRLLWLSLDGSCRLIGRDVRATCRLARGYCFVASRVSPVWLSLSPGATPGLSLSQLEGCAVVRLDAEGRVEHAAPLDPFEQAFLLRPSKIAAPPFLYTASRGSWVAQTVGSVDSAHTTRHRFDDGVEVLGFVDVFGVHVAVALDWERGAVITCDAAGRNTTIATVPGKVLSATLAEAGVVGLVVAPRRLVFVSVLRAAVLATLTLRGDE
jgi:hypothetical protein